MANPHECHHDHVSWTLDAIKEAGWECVDCGVRLGFRPDLDRARIEDKVRALLRFTHDAGLVHVSGVPAREMAVAQVAAYCRLRDVYDQGSIVSFLCDEQERRRTWQKTAHRWLEEHGEEHPR